MWKNQDDEESDDSDKIREKKKGRFRTKLTELADCEVFETELVDSDEPLSDEEKEVDETIMSDSNVDMTLDQNDEPVKKKTKYMTFES